MIKHFLEIHLGFGIATRGNLLSVSRMSDLIDMIWSTNRVELEYFFFNLKSKSVCHTWSNVFNAYVSQTLASKCF